MNCTEQITIDKLRHMKESEDHVEFKSARHNYPYNGGKHTDPRDRRHCVLGYIVALANERGGLMVLGMQDKMPHDVCGSDFAQGNVGQLEDAIYETLRIRVKAEELYEDEKRVLVIKVPSRPIGRLLKYEGVALMRVGESLREMSDTEMLAILSEQEPDYSARVCEGLLMEDLDENAVMKMVSMYADKQKNKTFINMPKEQVLIDLGLMAESKLNYAALVLLGKSAAIHKYLPQNEIIIEYRLNETSIQYTARKEFQEPLVIAIDKVWDYINQPASNPLLHVNDGPRILDIPAYNEDSIREAVLNACAHRSMQIQSSVVIKQSPKSISIINAGGFPIGVDLYNLLTTVSVPRAKRLCEVLEKIGLIERSGQGVDKIYYNNLAEGKDLPDYSESDAYQVVLKMKAEVVDPAFYLFIKKESENRNENHQLSVFHLLALHHINHGHVENVNEEMLEQLQDEGLIIQEGEEYRLNDVYIAMKLRARKKINEKINEKIKLTDRQKMVIDYILNNQLVNALDIASGLNIPKGSVYRIVGTLSSKELWLIEHVGSNKTGGYQLTSRGKRFLTENGYH